MSRGRKPIEPAKRFWPKVDASSTFGCWPWIAGLNRAGYGVFDPGAGDNPKSVLAHRFSYELLCGPIPPGLGLDHLCRNRRCVNPLHLEPVTQYENLSRSPITAVGRAMRKVRAS